MRITAGRIAPDLFVLKKVSYRETQRPWNILFADCPLNGLCFNATGVVANTDRSGDASPHCHFHPHPHVDADAHPYTDADPTVRRQSRVAGPGLGAGAAAGQR